MSRAVLWLRRVFGGDGAQPTSSPAVRAAAGVALLAVAGWVWWSITVGPARTLAQPREHNYDLRDGAAYGYTAALSDADRQGGRVGQQIVMVLYAGQREGRHQVHIRQGALLSALECSAPCEVVKMITVMDIPGVPAQPNVQMLRNAPGMLLGLALDDAINGKLAQYRDDQGRAVWVDSVSGVVRQP